MQANISESIYPSQLVSRRSASRACWYPTKVDISDVSESIYPSRYIRVNISSSNVQPMQPVPIYPSHHIRAHTSESIGSCRSRVDISESSYPSHSIRVGLPLVHLEDTGPSHPIQVILSESSYPSRNIRIIISESACLGVHLQDAGVLQSRVRRLRKISESNIRVEISGS